MTSFATLFNPKRRLLALGLPLSLLSAQPDPNQAETLAVSPCQNPKYSAYRSYANELDGLVVNQHGSQQSEDGGLYYIHCSDIDAHLKLSPCNLPKEAFRQGLKVKLTGQLIQYPGMDRSTLTWLPFELWSIRIVTH